MKWGRRHRGAVAALAVFMVFMAGAGPLVAWRENALRSLAETRRQDAELAAAAEKKAKEAEAAERKQAEAVVTLLESVFRSLNPSAEKKGGLPLLEQLVAQLDVAAASLDAEYAGQPLVRARLRDALGTTQKGLGEASKAVALHELALEERQAVAAGYARILANSATAQCASFSPDHE